MPELYIGLMSGTSMDGIDAALVDFSTPVPTLLQSGTTDYPAPLHELLLEAASLEHPLEHDLSQLDQGVGLAFAQAASDLIHAADVSPARILAIGSHGQTLRHEPEAAEPYSLQIGHAATIAAMTGCTVVADFRRADIEAGGQGAPLAPAFHEQVFGQSGQARIVLNIGGIANITVLPVNATASGHDTGPGNTLMDQWIRLHQNTDCDRNGAWAAGGQVDEALLARLMKDDWFSRPAPKSTGPDYFNLDWLQPQLADQPAENVQATLAALTVESIAREIERLGQTFGEILVCGGGVHNTHLMLALQNRLPDIPVLSTAARGVDPDQVEAIAFAWLARQRMNRKPANLPAVTGAREAVLLGDITRPQSDSD